MGARGPRWRPRRLLALETVLMLALASLLVPSAHALEECAMYSEDGLIITDAFWESGILSLVQGDYETHPLLDTADPGELYYAFRTENVVSVELINQLDAKYFDARLVDNSLEIRTSQIFNEIEKDINRAAILEIDFTLRIGCGSSSNIKTLTLFLLMKDTNNWRPTMAQESFALSLPVPVPVGTALLEVQGVDYDITGKGVEVQVEAEAADVGALFAASVTAVKDRAFTLRLTSAMEIRVKEPVAITLRITDLGTRDEPLVQRETAVQVTFTPDLANSVFSPRFQHPLYSAAVQAPEEVSAGGAVLAAPIAFEEGYADDLQLALADGGAHNGVSATEFVEVVRAGETVALHWRSGVDENRLEAFLAQPYALLVLTATAANAPQTGRTVVHLALPGAFAGTTQPPLLQLSFERDSYWKHLSREDPQGTVVAEPRLAGAPAVTGVRFSLESGGPSSPLGLLDVDASSGVVTLQVAPPPAGSFVYRLAAAAPGALTAHAELLVLGPAGVPCDKAAGEVCFANAVSVLTVPEGTRRQVLPALREADTTDACTFHALSDHAEFFEVDAQTGAAWVTKDVDREADAFGGAEAPVLRLALRMSCDAASGTNPDTNARTSARTNATVFGARDAGDWTEALGTVPYDQHSTVLLVVVGDVNDNPPIFDPPDLVVGFPDASLAERLRLPALFTAQATDKDVGENAALRYSLDEAGAALLLVDEESGAVYPRRDAAPAHGTRVVVRATDMKGTPGQAGTHTGNLPVILVTLAEEHLVEMRVDGALPDKVEELLNVGAGGDSQRNLRVLSVTVLPGDGDADADDDGDAADALPHVLRARRQAPRSDDDQPSHLRVVLYSLRDGAPEKANDFRKEVEAALDEAGWEAKVEKASLGGGGGGGGSGGSDAGLLAAVIALAVLLGVVLVAAGGAGYWFGIRPRRARHQHLRSDGSPSQLSVVDIEPLTEDIVKKPPSPALSFGDKSALAGPGLSPSSAAGEGGADAVRHSVMLGLPGEEAGDHETDDYAPPPSEGYEHPRPPPADHTYEQILPDPAPAPDTASLTSDQSQPQPRKTVIFNEEVDCIEIRM